MERKKEMKDLTEGNTYRSLVGFAVPILMGNLLQLTYKMQWIRQLSEDMQEKLHLQLWEQ